MYQKHPIKNRHIGRIALLLLLLLPAWALHGQTQRNITGSVVDEKGEMLTGVSVLVRGTTTGAVSDVDGNFSLAVDNQAVLTVSYLGYQTQLVNIDSRTHYHITMIEDNRLLEEVVVIGYGTMKKSDLTGAVSSVSAKDLTKQPSADVGEALQGRAAGLQIISSGKPGDNVAMKIRGTGTINNGDPLLVIDGVPTDIPLNMLNMQDIESVDVLKDASATAIYGSRGAYGVVIITTKKGQSGDGQIRFRASYGVAQPVRTLNLLDAAQFASLHNEMMAANGLPQNPDFEDPTLLGAGTDWLSLLFSTANVQDYSVAFSGGNDRTVYYLSGSLLDRQGIVKSTAYRRYTALFNLDTQLFPWFKIGNKLTISHDVKSAGGYDIGGTMKALPTQPLTNDDGSWSGPVGDPKYVGDIVNPIGRMNLNTSETKGYNLLGNVYGEIRCSEHLTFRSTAGLQALFWDSRDWTPKYAWEPIAQPESVAARRYNKSLTMLWDNILTFNRTFARTHALNAMIGSSAQVNTFEYIGGSIMQFVSASAQQLDNGTIEPTVAGNGSDWALLSLMARANYTYDSRYLLTATIRRDGSSRFSNENRWADFPSLSLAWRLSEEAFFSKSRLLNDVKLRAGYGLTGNQASVGNYASAAVLNTAQYTFNGTQANAIVPWVLPNRHVRWEEVEQFNVGADLALFDQHLFLNLDAYIKNTNDMLVGMSVPISSGYSDEAVPQVNAGRMRNRGLEATLNAQYQIGKLAWNAMATLSYNENEIVELYDGMWKPAGDIGLNSPVAIHAEGHPAGSFYGYLTDGIFQTQAEVDNHAIQTDGKDPYNRTAPGDIRFRDLNNDGVVNEQDRTYLGNPTPTWTFALNNALAWRGFDLEIYLQGVAGNRIFNANRVSLEAMSVAQNQSVAVLDRWRGENTSTGVPRAIFGDPNKNARVSDRFVEDGAYLRLKNVSLGYTLPAAITRKAYVASCRVYLSGQNLLTLTRYTGFDPEAGSSGIDNSLYPLTRSLNAGIEIVF
jgi:TonB-linked SusC/RagA family outer membrane protein